MNSPTAPVRRHFHGVRFYDSADGLGRIVAAFLAAGFVTQQAGLIIARHPHRCAIEAALRALNFSIEALQQSGILLVLDVDETLGALMINGTPDPVRFESVICSALERITRPKSDTIRVYDEMADALWSGQRPAAAGRLENLWDRVTVTHGCALVCGYAGGHSCDHGGRQTICADHNHVLAENGLPHPVMTA